MLVDGLAGGEIDTRDISPGRRLAGQAEGRAERAHSGSIGSAEILIEYGVAFARNHARMVIWTGNQLRGEGEIDRHGEHHLAIGVDRDGAPVEGSEVAGIDDRSAFCGRGVPSLIGQRAKGDAAQKLIKGRCTPHVLFLQRRRLEGNRRDRLGR